MSKFTSPYLVNMCIEFLVNDKFVINTAVTSQSGQLGHTPDAIGYFEAFQPQTLKQSHSAQTTKQKSTKPHNDHDDFKRPKCLKSNGK